MLRLGVRRRALFEPSGRVDLSSKKNLRFPIYSLSTLTLAKQYARDACANSLGEWAIIDFVFRIQKIDG
jgi:hypothetical protein